MPYEYIVSSANPILLILLTDESEESVKLVNTLIDRTIQINFDGDAPKNRCFISVIGYNHCVKDLCSGWLKDLNVAPLRLDSYIERLSDGAGGTIEVNCIQPIWVESVNPILVSGSYSDSIRLAIDICKEWSRDYEMAPIVIDCSEVFHMDCFKEIEQLKAIATKDGNVLFFGCYSKNENVSEIFSKMPEEWEYRFKNWGLKEDDYSSGLLNYEHIGSIFSAMMDVGGMPAI